MAGKKLRFAVVGIGGIGRGHVQSALDAEEAELTAMCDPLGEEVKKTLVEFGLSDERLSGIPVYEDYDEMLQKEKLDVVVISSPDITHCPYSVKAMDRGINVMCEKPLAVSDEEAAEMMEASRRNNVHFFAGQICRFAPAFAKAKEMIEEGIIGKVFCTEAQYVHGCHANLPADNWRKVNPRPATSCGGCHAIDIVRYFMGDPDEVFAYGNRFCRTDWVVEDCSETLMHYADGRIAKVLTTLGCVAEYSMRTVIYGTEGTITVNNTSNIVNYFTSATNKTMEIEVPVNTHNCLAETNEICAEILHGKKARHDGIEGAKTLLVCDAAIRSISSGVVEKLDYSKLYS